MSYVSLLNLLCFIIGRRVFKSVSESRFLDTYSNKTFLFSIHFIEFKSHVNLVMCRGMQSDASGLY